MICSLSKAIAVGLSRTLWPFGLLQFSDVAPAWPKGLKTASVAVPSPAAHPAGDSSTFLGRSVNLGGKSRNGHGDMKPTGSEKGAGSRGRLCSSFLSGHLLPPGP